MNKNMFFLRLVQLQQLLLLLLPTLIVSVKIRVYIHAGQSNMEGQGSIEHLQDLVNDPVTAERYQHLVVQSHNNNNNNNDDDDENHNNNNNNNDDNHDENQNTKQKPIDWIVREDVYVRYNEHERDGPLTTGFGFRTHKFGPELEFGHIMGNALHQSHANNNNNNNNNDDNITTTTTTSDILFILKTTWGGSSLACDFRPPMSGTSPIEYDLMGDDGTSQSKELINKTCGHRYHEMMTLIDETLFQNNHEYLRTKVLSLQKNDDNEDVDIENDMDNVDLEVEILGFLWFQGFSDVIDDRKLNEYPQNLFNLLTNVRHDLNLPNLPLIVGELGMQGLYPNPKHALMRQYQQNVTTMMSSSSSLHDDDDDHHHNYCQLAKISPYMVVDPTDGYDYDGVGNFHYNGRADNFIEIGRIFAETALRFLMDPTTPVSSSSSLSSSSDNDDDDTIHDKDDNDNDDNDDDNDNDDDDDVVALETDEVDEEQDSTVMESNTTTTTTTTTAVEIPAMEPIPEWIVSTKNKAQEVQEEMKEEQEIEQSGDDARWLRHARRHRHHR